MCAMEDLFMVTVLISTSVLSYHLSQETQSGTNISHKQALEEKKMYY